MGTNVPITHIFSYKVEFKMYRRLFASHLTEILSLPTLSLLKA